MTRSARRVANSSADWVTRGARWMVDENGQHMGIVRNRRWPYFLHHGYC